MTNQSPQQESNSNQLEIEPPTELTSLESAYTLINKEFLRIQDLLNLKSKSTPGSPLGEYLEKLQNIFANQVSKINGELKDLRKVVNPKTPPSEGDIIKAWKAYHFLKVDLIPHLSKDLLSLLGGVYLKEIKLDVMEPAQKQNVEAQSFSELAEKMVKDLGYTQGWESVLIVGEENWSSSGSEIIRLRFPACDIWHLPFTAYEYFYLVAQIDNKAPVDFPEAKKKVVGNVDPSQPGWKTPPDEKCYLSEVRQLWSDYENLKADPLKWEAYYQDKKERIHELEELQRAYLCRLFADVFATYYIGPAYLHALLNLQFTPYLNYSLNQHLPPIKDRFVFAMETLNWMNKTLVFDAGANDKTFERELHYDPGKPSGLRDLWKLALRSTGENSDPYDQLAKDYRPWIDMLQDILSDNLYYDAGERTINNWKDAQKLETVLPTKTDLKLNFIPSRWAVVNAAWSARWLYSSTSQTIRDNALRLLNLHDTDKSWYENPASEGNQGSKAQAVTMGEFDRSAAIERINNYLSELSDVDGALAFLDFSKMNSSNTFKLDQVSIKKVLSKTPELLKDFIKLSQP